jgi:hypothetical protein
MARITKKLKTEYVRKMLTTNKNWALRCLTVVYSNQTADEQCAGRTAHDNSIGFTGTDGEFMSSLASQYEKRKSLSPKQMAHVMKKMPKYHRQVLAVMDDKKLIDCMHRDGIVTSDDVDRYQTAIFIREL